MYVDLTPGAPAAWRSDALAKAVAYLGPRRLIFGSDASPANPEYTAQIIEADRRILRDQIGLDDDAMEWVFWRSCAGMFGEGDD
jgi:predicted TIM-barrel fold metal-dependent hydrolase